MPLKNKSLNNVRVLVTRPVHQQKNFIRLLTKSGAVSVSFPLVIISAPNNPADVSKHLESVDSADYVIFVSSNAVNFAHNLRPLPWQSCTAKFASVGDVTAKTLLHYGSPVDLSPTVSYSGEALLDLDELKHIDGKRVVVIQGDKSRKYLINKLAERNAIVDVITVYRNNIPKYKPERLAEIFSEIKPQVICITSNQSILNLTKIMGERYLDQLVHTPLIVNSERCSKLARELGFKAAIEVADKPGDPGQLEGLKRWYSTSNNNHSE